MVNDLSPDAGEIYFVVPSMFVGVGVTLALLRRRHQLTRAKGITLACLFVAYLSFLIALFAPKIGAGG